jgi:hypothetical protein
MSQILSPSLARGYGKARVVRVWKISRASVYRSLKETPSNTIARRPGPVGACSDAELAEHIRQQIAASRLHGEGCRKLWARLRFAGVRTSPRRVRRVMRENGFRCCTAILSQFLAYVATDSAGLTSTTTRTVIIEAPSIVPSDDASTTPATSTGSLLRHHPRSVACACETRHLTIRHRRPVTYLEQGNGIL